MAKAAAAVQQKLVSMSAVKCATLGIIGMVGLLISAVGPFKVPFAETLAKTYYRQAVMGLALVVLVVGGLITAVVKLFDPNQFKDQIVRYVHERTQRNLVLDGELTMRYFPKLGIESGKASLSQRRSAREFASIERARVTLSWLKLLRGRMHVDHIEVEGLRAQVVRFKDGSTNIDDLARDVAAIDAARIDVDSLRVSNSTLQWNDEIAWQRGSVNDLFIDLGHLADGVPSPLIAGARVDAPAAGVDAKLQLKGRLMFDAAAGRLELARIDGALEGKALGINNLALQLKGDVTGLPRERVLNAENVVLSSMHKSGLTVFNTVVSAPELKFGEYRLSGTSLNVDASMAHPDRTTTLALKVPRFEWADRALRDTAVQAQLALRSADTRLSAQFVSPLVLALEGGPRVELGAIDMRASASHPALAAEVSAQLGGKLEWSWSQQMARAEWTGQLGGHEVKGELAVSDFERPRWAFELDALRLDLDALLSSAWLARWSDDASAFDMSALRDVNLKGGVRVGHLKLGGLQASGASARFELDRAVLAIEPIAAQAYGAQLEAVVQVDASAAPRISTKGSLNEADLRGLLADVSARPWLEGRGALTWDVASDGASVGSLRQGLKGAVNLSARAGALAGIDLRAALLEGRSELGKRAPALQREYSAGAATPFGELTARFELRDGLAHGQALELNANALRAVGEGDLTFDTGALDWKLQASVGKATAELAPLAGVTVPVQVRGPWRQPRIAFDFGAATGDKVPRVRDGADGSVALVKGFAPAASDERTDGAALTLK